MKKTYALSKISLLAMLMILSVVFACKDDDKDDPTPPASNDPIVATWQLTAVAPAAGATLPIDPAVLIKCIYSLKLTFKADYSLTTADCQDAVTFINAYVPISESTWEVKDGNLTLKSKSNGSKTFKYTINGSDMDIFVDDIILPGSPAIDVILKLKKV
jgi:hypothetical protein